MVLLLLLLLFESFSKTFNNLSPRFCSTVKRFFSTSSRSLDTVKLAFCNLISECNNVLNPKKNRKCILID